MKQAGKWAIMTESLLNVEFLHHFVAEPPKKVVGTGRFELTTSCSQSRRSTRLSYVP